MQRLGPMCTHCEAPAGSDDPSSTAEVCFKIRICAPITPRGSIPLKGRKAIFCGQPPLRAGSVAI